MELEVVHLVSLSAFVVAMVFGAIANKSHFCTMGAFSDWVNMGTQTRMRTWVLAIGVALFCSQAMHVLGWVDINQAINLTPRFGWLGHVLGGFLFGIGMTIAGGCGQRTLVRLGGGNLKSLVVLLMLGISAYMTLRGLFALARINYIEIFAVDLTLSGFSNQGLPHILAETSGFAENGLRIAVTLIAVAFALWYVFKDSGYRKNTENIITGLVIGLICASAWYITGVMGFDDFEPVALEGMSFIAPVGNSINYLMTFTGSTIGFGIATVGGLILGSFLYAIASKTFRVESFTNKSDMINHMVGGLIMGFGGVLALGCTIGQGLTGLSTLAVGSVITIISIGFGCVLTLKMQFNMLDDGFWKSLHLSLSDMRLMPTPKDE
jgi:uncharacterized protein